MKETIILILSHVKSSGEFYNSSLWSHSKWLFSLSPQKRKSALFASILLSLYCWWVIIYIIRDFHDAYLNNIWLFQNAWILVSFDLNSVLTRKISEKVAYSPTSRTCMPVQVCYRCGEQGYRWLKTSWQPCAWSFLKENKPYDTRKHSFISRSII